MVEKHARSISTFAFVPSFNNGCGHGERDGYASGLGVGFSHQHPAFCRLLSESRAVPHPRSPSW